MNSETHPYASLLGIQVVNVGKGTATVRAKVIDPALTEEEFEKGRVEK